MIARVIDNVACLQSDKTRKRKKTIFALGASVLIVTFSIRCLLQPPTIALGGNEGGEGGKVSIIINAESTHRCRDGGNWARGLGDLFSATQLVTDKVTQVKTEHRYRGYQRKVFPIEVCPVKTVGLDRAISEDLFCSTFCNSTSKTFWHVFLCGYCKGRQNKYYVENTDWRFCERIKRPVGKKRK